ncbi:MAG: hypothetical protein ABFS86_14215 [Planctomycetota bacterium]
MTSTRLLLLTVGVVLLAVMGAVWSDALANGEEVELDEAEVFIEWNSTDTDYGIQFFWDCDGFTKMKVRNDDGKTILNVRTKRNLKDHGLTEGFFESVEPPSSVLSMEEFLDRFPEGEYGFVGKGIDGDTLVGEAEFTHVLPAPPTNLYPAEDDVVSHLGFVASFDPVTKDTNGDPVTITQYIVVVEKEDDEPILQTFTVILPPTRTSVTVPAEFLEPDTEYKLEVIAQEESGNRTITEEGSFLTDD